EFRSAAREADLIHFHMPFPLAAWCWPFIPKRAKVVVLYHSDIVRQKKISFLYHPPLKRLLRRSDAITASSPPMRQNSPILSQFADKTHVIPFMTDPPVPLDAGLEAELRRRHGLTEDDAVVLYVGRLVYYKGIMTLLEAWQGVPAKLLIVGDGPMLGEVEETIARLGLAERVILAGRASDHELPHYYRIADLFVLPSIEVSEAYALVQMDALAAGLPVVNTNLPTGVPWVSRDGESGLTVPPKDPDSLREAVSRLLTDSELRSRLAAGALKRAQDFTPEHVLAETLAVYRKIGAEF
ncbi:MAG: glycosyltransferase, partial [Fimbriimonadaceae bacterium]